MFRIVPAPFSFLGEESLGEKYMGEKYVQEEFLCEKYMGEKSVGEKSLGENRGRWDAGFRYPLPRFCTFSILAFSSQNLLRQAIIQDQDTCNGN